MKNLLIVWFLLFLLLGCDNPSNKRVHTPIYFKQLHYTLDSVPNKFPIVLDVSTLSGYQVKINLKDGKGSSDVYIYNHDSLVMAYEYNRSLGVLARYVILEDLSTGEDTTYIYEYYQPLVDWESIEGNVPGFVW